MVSMNNTPFGKERLQYLEENIIQGGERKYITQLGYISGYWLEKDSLTLLVVVEDGFDDGIVVEAKYSTRAGENSELFLLLEEFHCLCETFVELKFLFNYMAVGILFEYNKVCKAFFAKEIFIDPTQCTFSGEVSTKQLERIMYQEYRNQEEQKERGTNR